MLTELERALATFEWQFTQDGLRRANEILETAAQPRVLSALLEHTRETPSLAGRCERKPYQDKLVLYRSERGGAQLVLHVYRAGHFERPCWIHNHRAEFAVVILRGGYVHTLYSVGEPPAVDDTPVSVRVLYARDETAGSRYALSTAAFHSVRAWPDSVTLLLRGPATADRALYVTEDGRRRFWRQAEGAQDSATERMTPDALADAIGVVRQLTLTTEPARREARTE